MITHAIEQLILDCNPYIDQFILDPKSKQYKVNVTNLKNLPKLQIFEFWKKNFTHNTTSEVAW